MASENETPMEEAKEELGEMFELSDEISEVEDTEDGGAIVRLGGEEEEPEGEGLFYANLGITQYEG